MAFVHGSDTVILIDTTDDISQYCTQSDLKRTVDSHDVTTYGKKTHVYRGGLGDGTSSISGLYDNTAVTGPRAVLEPLLGTNVELIRRPEGTGTGKPQDKVTVLVGEYTETAPVADMVTWSLSLQLSGEVDSTAQAA
jgi:hypothetical protein